MAVESSADARLRLLAELTRGLSAVSSWSQLIACVARTLVPVSTATARIWALPSEGPYELARFPEAGELPVRSAQQIKRASTHVEVTSDRYLLAGLHTANSVPWVLEMSIDGVTEGMMRYAAPVIALAAATITDSGGQGFISTGSPQDDIDNGITMSLFAAQAQKLLPHDRLSAYLVTPDGRFVERLAVASSPVLRGESVIIPFADFGLRHVLLTNDCLVSDELGTDRRIVGREDRIIAEGGYHSLLSAPLRIDDRPIGLLNFVSRRVGFFDDKDVSLAQQLADHAAVFLAGIRRQRAQRVWESHQAAERERTRLSRELEGTLVIGLPQIAREARELAACLLSPTSAVDRASRLAAHADSVLADAQYALADLIPPALETVSVVDIVDAELAAVRDHNGLETHFNHHDREEQIPLPAKRAIHRILQEALNNVRHHSGASRVDVFLDVGVDATLRIMDNGRGFDTSNPYRSENRGLQIIRDRARLLGGNVLVHSESTTGTTITVSLPEIHGASDMGADIMNAPMLLPASSGIRVFVIQSRPLLLAGIAHVLDRNPDVRVVGQSLGNARIRDRVASLRPDAVLIDLDIDEDLTEATIRAVAEVSPEATLIGISDSVPGSAVPPSFDAVRGVLSKDVPIAELADEFLAILRDPGVRTAHDTDPTDAVRLSTNEFAVLTLIAMGQTNAEIGRTLFTASKTVERYVSTLITKLRARNRSHAVAIAVTSGLLRLPHRKLNSESA